MVCYVVPAAAGIVHYFFRRKNPSLKNNEKQRWLSMLFLGGSIFGVVDHLWNRELFMIGPNILQDLMLGLAITLTIIISWGIMIALDKASVKKETKTLN